MFRKRKRIFQKGEGVFRGRNRQTSKQKGGQIEISYNDAAGFSIGYKKKLKNKKKNHQKGGSAIRRAIYRSNPGIAGHRAHPPFKRSTNPYQIQSGGSAIYDPNLNPTSLGGRHGIIGGIYSLPGPPLHIAPHIRKVSMSIPKRKHKRKKNQKGGYPRTKGERGIPAW